MLHILYIVTDSKSLQTHLLPQLKTFVRTGWRVGAICGGNKAVLSSEELAGVNAYYVPMRREIHLLSDILALARLFSLLLRLRPAIVNAGTPKAGLIGMIAAWLARVPVRVYQLHGLRLETATGWKNVLLWVTEMVACLCAHRVLCVSPSLKQKAAELRLCPFRKLFVLGSGSCAGVEVADYSPTPERLARAEESRKALGIPARVPVVGFIGRLTRDKGFWTYWRPFRSSTSVFLELTFFSSVHLRKATRFPKAFVRESAQAQI